VCERERGGGREKRCQGQKENEESEEEEREKGNQRGAEPCSFGAPKLVWLPPLK